MGGAMAVATGWRRWDHFATLVVWYSGEYAAMWLSLKTQQLQEKYTTIHSTASTRKRRVKCFPTGSVLARHESTSLDKKSL